MLSTIIASLALVAAVFFAIRYIVKEKRSGKKCIGCPVEGTCGFTQLTAASSGARKTLPVSVYNHGKQVSPGGCGCQH